MIELWIFEFWAPDFGVRARARESPAAHRQAATLKFGDRCPFLARGL